MDILFLCNDDRADSLVGTLLLAVEGRKAGKDVGVMFSAAALVALRSESFLWPRRFWPQDIRWSLADQAAAAGLPVTGRGQARAMDVMGILGHASQQGIRLLACPVWSELLTPGYSPPVELREVTVNEALELIDSSKRVIGGF